MQLPPFRLARRMAEEHSALQSLSSSDCDGPPLRTVLEWADDQTRALWNELSLGYATCSGLPLLRAEIAGRHRAVSPDEILVGAPQEMLFLAYLALLRPGDHVISTSPAYQPLHEVARSIGCAVTPWPADEEAGWRFDLAVLQEAFRPETRLVVINFPHNPTGSQLTHDEFAALIDLVAERGLHLFSDEMFRGLELDPGQQLPSAIDVYPRAIVLNGLSKTFGLGGVRIGWVVTKDGDLRRRMEALKDYTTSSSSAPGEVLALIGLRAQQHLLERNRATVRRNVASLAAFIEQWPDHFQCVLPRAGTLAFPRLLQESATAFCSWARNEGGLSILPSTLYEYGDRHIRLGLGRRDLPDGLAILSEGMKARRAT